MTASTRRVVTALVLVSGVAAALWAREYADFRWGWEGMLAVIVLLALWEWARLLGRTPVQIAGLLAAGLIALGLIERLSPEDFEVLLWIATGIWGVFLLRLTLPVGLNLLDRVLFASLGLVALPVTAWLLMRMPGLEIVVLLVWVMAADTGA